MLEENLHAFLLRVVNDASMQDQLRRITDKTVFTETLIGLGRDNGFHFRAEDVEVLYQSKVNPLPELSDAELARVVGGAPDAGTPDGGVVLRQWGDPLPPSQQPAGSRDAGTTLFGYCSCG